MHTACLSLYSPIASITTTTKSFTYKGTPKYTKLWHGNSITCKASSSSSSSMSSDLDLYDLLGIDSSSNHSQIKAAYRLLQKRCHPDIAGPPGHDMAIILNEAYNILSDPTSRLAYDKDQAKVTELRGYTGKPIYSVWFGSESEERAVFVDEVNCVGCLKCALFAQKTFAIESIYGRARVVVQWADPEDKIQAAIETCPVDCISMVHRSDLAALEFLMSKQPRGNVRVGASNTAGARVANIFVEVKKFKARVDDAINKTAKQNSKETELQREARSSAIQAIRSISNWLYWLSPNEGTATSKSHHLMLSAPKSTEPNVDKLRDAAAARKQASNARPINRTPSDFTCHDEYWSPSMLPLPASTLNNSSSKATAKISHLNKLKKTGDEDYKEGKNNRRNPIGWAFPLGTATIAAVIVRLQGGEGMVGGINEHIGGSLALEIVNSSWLQVPLAWVTWYLFGVVIITFVEALRNQQE
ncbi:DnaJ domain-containing protein/Fer4_15 domain-containing protein [Cephalotus follicularis]|uniref:DnaJ domain-containing protein/Fer4_15 domain-containing protein n=1 Tax=Cephalotus follicularis TaxID=3775 RepID=A0A1Q3BWG6_CEPFO|nr:DnaJ domain-containing protein/Fer4_15 domain-containing protein [Cephalotus follicularis]